MTPRKLFTLAAFSLAAALPALAAQADSGIYLGGGASRTKIEDSFGNPGGVNFDQTATGLKLFTGYKFDLLPLLKLAAEVGYRDTGRATDTVAPGVDINYRAHGFDYGVLAGLGLGPVDLFGRVGGMNYRLDKEIGGVTNHYDGTAPVYGVGLWFTIFHVGVRAEYERIHIDELDKVNTVSVSAFFQF